MPNTQRQIYKRAKINQIKLDGCTRHRFNVELIPVALGAKAVCLSCGGAMPVLEVAQYIRGFIAAGGDPEAVCPGFWPVDVPYGVVHCPACNGVGVSDEQTCGLCNGSGHIKPAQAIAYIESL